jgi:FtsZ-binding cell division protein ZapB
MDIKSLKEKKASIDQQFNALNERNTELQNEATKNTEELLRLQGEYRYTEELLSTTKEPKKEK